MQTTTGFMKALKCPRCGGNIRLPPHMSANFDFGPLEVVYDYDRIKRSLSKAAIASRPQNMWRYANSSRCYERPSESRSASRH